MTTIRKIVFVEERILAEAGRAAARPTTRVAGIAVIANPFAGQGHIEDLSALFEVGARLGEAIMPDVVRRLENPATSYGKAAIVGVAGDFEHGGALIHPKLGKPMRAAVGGGAPWLPAGKASMCGRLRDWHSDVGGQFAGDRIDVSQCGLRIPGAGASPWVGFTHCQRNGCPSRWLHRRATLRFA